MKKRCRLCLETNAGDYYSIHEECNGGPTYAEFVQQLAAVEIEFDDSLPQDVCEECHSELQRILEFSAGIRRADEELRNELNNDKHRKQVDAAQENQYRAQEDAVCVMEEVLELDADNQESFVLEEIQEEMHLDEDILELHNEVITDEVITDEVATDVDKKPCLQKEDLLAKLAHVAATQENVNVIDKNATYTTKDYAKDENDEDYLIEFDPNETLSPNLKPPKWKCGECKVVLRGDVSYEGHMNMHKQLKPHKCSNCNWEFRCRTALKKHQESRHTSPAILELNVDTEKSQPRYICEKCSLPFKTEVQCYLHKIIFHKMYSKITTCPFCSSILVESLKDHLETFHTDNDITEDILTNNDNVVNTVTSSTFSTVWQCNQCSNTYPSLELLSNHQHLYHKSDQQQSEDIKVDYLDDIPTFTKVDYIEDEPITTSSTKDAFDNTSVQCEICKRKLLRRNLNKHMDLHNRQDKDEDRPKKFLCAHCPREFQNLKSLRQHQRIHQGESADVVYVCGDCERQYASEFLLETHRKQAHKERDNVCPICGNAFKLKNQLVNHMKLHLEKNIQCPHCDKKYARQFDLNVHLRSHTGEQPFACHLCDKRFAIKVRLTYHLQKHYGIKHQCKECGAEFNSKQKLKGHSFKHTGMPYRCELCDDHGFATRNVFKRHLNRVHHATISDEALNEMFQQNTGKTVKIKQVSELGELVQTTDDEDGQEILDEKAVIISSPVIFMETDDIITNI